jgi:hypothetical protein
MLALAAVITIFATGADLGEANVNTERQPQGDVST